MNLSGCIYVLSICKKNAMTAFKEKEARIWRRSKGQVNRAGGGRKEKGESGAIIFLFKKVS